VTLRQELERISKPVAILHPLCLERTLMARFVGLRLSKWFANGSSSRRHNLVYPTALRPVAFSPTYVTYPFETLSSPVCAFHPQYGADEPDSKGSRGTGCKSLRVVEKTFYRNCTFETESLNTIYIHIIHYRLGDCRHWSRSGRWDESENCILSSYDQIGWRLRMP